MRSFSTDSSLAGRWRAALAALVFFGLDLRRSSTRSTVGWIVCTDNLLTRPPSHSLTDARRYHVPLDLEVRISYTVPSPACCRVAIDAAQKPGTRGGRVWVEISKSKLAHLPKCRRFNHDCPRPTSSRPVRPPRVAVCDTTRRGRFPGRRTLATSPLTSPSGPPLPTASSQIPKRCSKR